MIPWVQILESPWMQVWSWGDLRVIFISEYNVLYFICSHYICITLFLMMYLTLIQFSPVQFSCSVVSDSLRPHELQYARCLCPLPTPRVHPNPCPLSPPKPNHLILCHPLLLLPSIFPASGSFLMSQLFTSGGQSIGVSASTSILPMNTQD